MSLETFRAVTTAERDTLQVPNGTRVFNTTRSHYEQQVAPGHWRSITDPTTVKPLIKTTTAVRDALDANAGTLLFNTTTGKWQTYNTAWLGNGTVSIPQLTVWGRVFSTTGSDVAMATQLSGGDIESHPVLSASTIGRVSVWYDNDSGGPGADKDFTVKIKTCNTSGTISTIWEETFNTDSPTTTFTGVGQSAPLKLFAGSAAATGTIEANGSMMITVNLEAGFNLSPDWHAEVVLHPVPV